MRKLITIFFLGTLGFGISWAVSSEPMKPSSRPSTNPTSSTTSSTQPTAIPEELRSAAERVFAQGKPLFIWSTDKNGLTLAPNFPVGICTIGYAFAPKANVSRFTVKAMVVRKDSNGKLSGMTAVLPGPEQPEKIGTTGCVIAVTTADEITASIGLDLAKGKGEATIVVVTAGTKPTDENPGELSNQIVIPVTVGN